MLEIQVAFALLGIGLAGLGPFVVMQLRQTRRLERRFQGTIVAPDPVTHVDQTMLSGKTYYIVPWKNDWARKLTRSAPILESSDNTCDPDETSPGMDPLPVKVKLIDLHATPTGEEVTVLVDLEDP